MDPNPAGLPDDVQPCRRIDVFTEGSVPKGLLKTHTTKAGPWALIHVLEGRINTPRRPAAEAALTPDTAPGGVEPTISHEVEPLGLVRFFVEFHRRPEG